MSEPTPDSGKRPIEETSAPKASIETRDYRSILQALVGKNVTIVNPESYETAAMGFQLKEGIYGGKVGSIAKDFVLLHTVIQTSKKEGGKVAVKQFVPIERIKRISMMKDEYILHL
ncbi:MAG: hypothetical protein ACYTGZ_22405 [Planctomycetota bacterium]|jgi:hypothetical protein